ncbi:hypothetical protein [Thermosulfurimonas sp. F29]|uniref:F0F1 ATP synthase subunit B family protein n=1 Tax=Thermosulfurimonas sp. F29 TaxID=2867247 RepID=UPI001C82CB93|nr:hypothetical protein [Thermosulfurimonas sp. F29]MBX6422675.1 hypothetical protein [Thermosulfurimonas sp. F29]
MLNFDITLWLTIIEALIFTFIFNALLIRPVMRTLEERRSRFEGLKSETETLLARAEESLRAYEEGLAEARSRAAAEREALRAKAREEERRILEEAAREAEAYKEKVFAEIQAQIESARKALSEQVEVFSRAMAEKILGRAL